MRVVPLPGACAFTAAATGSGLPTDSLLFIGFLPPKAGARRKRLLELSHESATLLFYAPPHGLRAILADMAEVWLCVGGVVGVDICVNSHAFSVPVLAPCIMPIKVWGG